VEKSLNGRWFSQIGTLTAKGVSNNTETYNYLDQTPNQDESFFRIKSVSESGETQYSQ
jgi:hypothetical protein